MTLKSGESSLKCGAHARSRRRVVSNGSRGKAPSLRKKKVVNPNIHPSLLVANFLLMRSVVVRLKVRVDHILSAADGPFDNLHAAETAGPVALLAALELVERRVCAAA
jgi:hypothetical protein